MTRRDIGRVGIGLVVGWAWVIGAAGCEGDDNGPADGGTEDAAADGSDGPGEGTPDAADVADNPAEAPPDTAGDGSGGATVAGTAARSTGTCPDAYGSIGTLCVAVRSSCADPASATATAQVPNADMTGPLGFSDPVPFSVGGVGDGSWQVYAFLDNDESGCAAPNAGDLTLAAGCLPVTVAGGGDVRGVTVIFDTIVR